MEPYKISRYRLFDLTEIIVWNIYKIYDIELEGKEKSEFVAKTQDFEKGNQSYESLKDNVVNRVTWNYVPCPFKNNFIFAQTSEAPIDIDFCKLMFSLQF